MSSADFQKVLVRDERLNCKDSIKYAVQKSGQNITVAEFAAISQNQNSHTYNIQVPSETTIIDRRVIWESTVVARISVPAAAATAAVAAGVAGNTPLASLGYTNALGPFPLHSACLTQQFTINNNSVSINMNDVLPVLLRFHDKRELMRYNGMTPNMYDTYNRYVDGVGGNNNVLGNYSTHSLDNDLYARGSFLDVQVSGSAGSAADIVPAFGSAGVFALPTVAQAAAAANPRDNVYYIRYTVREPLLASPFMWCKSTYSGQGFYGIQNLNIVFNLSTDNVSRIWRSGNLWESSSGNPATISILSYSGSRLIFNFLTPKPSDMLSARNVVPYWEMPRYLSTQTASIAYATRGAAGAAVPPVAAFDNTGVLIPADTRLTFTTTQLNQIPDKLLIFVRKQKSSQQISDGDFALAIRGISINFNNQSGILASATQDQLYRYSVEAGSNQSWEEFRGYANKADNADGLGFQIPTSGSYLMLDMGRHIQITEDYYAAGSLGNFNLQFSLEVSNYTEVPFNNVAPASATMPIEMVLITLNSGLFVCEKGQSATYTGILTKDDVLTASQQTPHSSGDVERLVGGGLLDKLGSMASAVAPSLLKEGAKLVPSEIKSAICGSGRSRRGIDDRLR
ncbi:putative major capsid protein [Dishui Lake virophage 6]|nr:putative major capsid protein [Dishui Lake virophage 6]